MEDYVSGTLKPKTVFLKLPCVCKCGVVVTTFIEYFERRVSVINTRKTFKSTNSTRY